MGGSGADTVKEMPLGVDEKIEEEYASQSKLLQEFINISSIDKAWVLKSDSGMSAYLSAPCMLKRMVLYIAV